MWTLPNTSMDYRRDTELPGVTKIAFYTMLNKSNREERVKYAFVHASKKRLIWGLIQSSNIICKKHQFYFQPLFRHACVRSAECADLTREVNRLEVAKKYLKMKQKPSK